MTECLETFAAVVGSYSAVPDSSEGKVSIGGLYDGVVDTGSARCGVLYHVACPFFAAGKVVEGEGLFPVVDVFDTVVAVVEREYGEYGAMYRSAGSLVPPLSIVPCERSADRRSKCRALTIRG